MRARRRSQPQRSQARSAESVAELVIRVQCVDVSDLADLLTRVRVVGMRLQVRSR